MRIQQEPKDYIKEAFEEMKSKEDFLALINYAKVLIYSEKAVPFSLKHIIYHANPKANQKRYSQFSIRKKSGSKRTINAPCSGLKAIQKCLNLIFQTIYEVHPAATGFVPGKSIVDNAKIHQCRYYVYNIDLKDFFTSIEASRIFYRFQHPPFNLYESNGRKTLAHFCTWLCCHEIEIESQVEYHQYGKNPEDLFTNFHLFVESLYKNDQSQKEKKNALPQGAPTSPILSNIICEKLDFKLSAVAKWFGLKYSRYADDITFSSMHNVFQKDSDFIKELQRIITEQHFQINSSKTRLQKQGYRQEVTGLLVNEKPNVQHRYIKQLRMWLYYWETYGYERASSYFMPQYNSQKGNTKKGDPNMTNIIAGKLDYLKMVKGNENAMYLKLRSRYEILAKIARYT